MIEVLNDDELPEDIKSRIILDRVFARLTKSVLVDDYYLPAFRLVGCLGGLPVLFRGRLPLRGNTVRIPAGTVLTYQ
jgi:hypothetical protein